MNALITLVAVTCAADLEQEVVLGRIAAHCAAIRSVRIRGVERYVKEGGVWTANPATAKVVTDPADEVSDFEYWAASPQLRSSLSAVKPNGTSRRWQEYFDGHIYTVLEPSAKTALIHEGGGPKPKMYSPLQAIGYAYPDTFQTSLSDLFANRKAVKLSRHGDEWEVLIDGLPDSVSTAEMTDGLRKRTQVRVWVSDTDPVQIRRWAIYFRVDSEAARKVYAGDHPCPAFEVAGYAVIHCFVNCDLTTVNTEDGRGKVWLPKRILQGNGHVAMEAKLNEVAVNPKEPANAFRPTIPSGYTVTRVNGATEVVGGEGGVAVKVGQITQEARDLLRSADGLRANQPGWWAANWWLLPAGCLVALVAVAASVARAKYRRRGV